VSLWNRKYEENTNQTPFSSANCDFWRRPELLCLASLFHQPQGLSVPPGIQMPKAIDFPTGLPLVEIARNIFFYPSFLTYEPSLSPLHIFIYSPVFKIFEMCWSQKHSCSNCIFLLEQAGYQTLTVWEWIPAPPLTAVTFKLWLLPMTQCLWSRVEAGKVWGSCSLPWDGLDHPHLAGNHPCHSL
jgi:hypothetical protein